MKLVVGLGNPETKYNWTRHNTGFLVLDYYFKVKGLKWSDKPRLGAVWAKDGEIVYIKPQDHYNLSGRAVREYMRYYKITLDDVVVVCDDFNLEFGKLRYRAAGSAGGNNGLKSIIAEVGSEDFARIRVGTGNDELRAKMGDVDFVLSKYTTEEKARLPEVLNAAVVKIDGVILDSSSSRKTF